MITGNWPRTDTDRHGLLGRRFIGFVVVMIVASCLAQEAFGHAFLDKSEPGVGSTVTAAPTEVKIAFTDDVNAKESSIQVTNGAGKEVDKQDLHLEEGRTDTLVVSLKPLPPGTYTVSWHAMCPDGHKTEGSFEFTVKRAK
jgi:methionine-rich copper-binding protein CopC